MNSYFNSMKPIFSLLLLGVVLLTACQSSKQSEGVAPNIDSLEQALAQSTDPLERIELKRQIVELKMEAATPEERCQMFEDFVSLVEEAVGTINERESDYLEHYYTYHLDEQFNPIEPHDSIKQKEQGYIQRGLQFDEVGEGIVLLAPAPTLFAKYLSQLPTYYQEYWQLLRDSENIAPDACLVLTWRELGDLIVRYEAYAESNPEQKELFVRLSDNYQYLQMVYMTGTDNTPIANESGSLDPELKSEWQRFMKAYPNSLTTELIKDFLQLKNYSDLNAMQERLEEVQKTSNHPLLLASSFL
ncbi:hypothetical protein [Porphyromonas endodontalis]|uniref:hypothetical protein n=1 Tax=Porphyromonas endodontalis TaxID=28124 RepID=UPI00248E4BC5|nr:hypothetical protein [Porphyromonas endodontalis]